MACYAIWMALIGLSVLTTWQHHFIDVPTGALAGWLCVWLWPIEGRSPLHNLRLAREPQRWRLALRYGLGAVCAALAVNLGGARRLLLALRIAAAGSAELRAVRRGRHQKHADGSLSAASSWLLAPYLPGAWVNSALVDTPASTTGSGRRGHMARTRTDRAGSSALHRRTGP